MKANMECSVCNTEFDIQGEGGISGEFGIIPVQFCPTCLSCMIDMVSQLQDMDSEINE